MPKLYKQVVCLCEASFYSDIRKWVNSMATSFRFRALARTIRWVALGVSVAGLVLGLTACGGGGGGDTSASVIDPVVPVVSAPVLAITTLSPVAVASQIVVRSDKALGSVDAVTITTPAQQTFASTIALSSDKLSIVITPELALPYATNLTLTVKATASGVAGSVTGSLTTEAAPDTTPLIDVHFAVLTRRPEALARATDAQMRREVDILNTYFKGADGSKPVRFRFKNLVYANQLPATVCAPLVALGDLNQAYSYTTLMAAYNGCTDSRLVDPQAINVYVYDSYTRDGGDDDITSHGIHNSGHPLVLFDWERLDHTTQSPEEHEFGHVFGLAHVCVPGATLSSSTNIMASTENCNGSGGLRNIGFDASQLSTIKNRASVIVQAFQ